MSFIRAGLESEIRFSIPLGGHDLCVTHLPRGKGEAPVRKPRVLAVVILTGLLVILTALYTTALLENRTLRQSLNEGAMSVGRRFLRFGRTFFQRQACQSVRFHADLFEFPGTTSKYATPNQRLWAV